MGENEKTKRKLLTKKNLGILLIIFLLLAIGLIIFLKLNAKEDLTYLKTSKQISKQGQFLNETLLDVMDVVAKDNVNGKVNFSDMQIVNSNYNDCDGIIEPVKGFYNVTANCKKEKDGVYKIKQTLSKGSKLFQMHNVSKIDDGYLFWGMTENSQGIVGILTDDGIINWETEVDFDASDSTFLSVEIVKDGYIAIIQKEINEKTSELKMIKMDKTGKITKTNVIKLNGYVLLPKSNNNDMIVISSDDKLFILNKDGDIIKEMKQTGVTSIAITEDIIYFIDSNETIYSCDKSGNKKIKLENLDKDKGVMFFEVVNNNYFLVYSDKVLTLDNDGNVINEFIYSSLAVPKEKVTMEQDEGVMLNCYRKDNNLFVTYMVDGYIIFDEYSQKFELLERNIYEHLYLNINAAFYNLNLFSKGEVINLNYDSDTKLFVKTIYE